MLVLMKELLQPTRQYGFAIGAFNVADNASFAQSWMKQKRQILRRLLPSIHSEHDFAGILFVTFAKLPSVVGPVCTAPSILVPL